MWYRKIPVEVEAKLWDGTNVAELIEWTDGCFRTADDGIYTGDVYDELHSTWVLLRTGDMVIRGIKGEFYPCEKSIFAQTYEPVG